jgi:hypothetical protein
MTRPVYLQQRTYVVTAGSPAAGADDPFFAGLQRELADKSFLLTTADNLITWARTGSLMWMTFGLACCAIEMMQMSMPRYDAERTACQLRSSRRIGAATRAAQNRSCNKMAPAPTQGLVRQRRWLLPLFLFGGARLRPHRAGRYLGPRLSADRRSAALRRAVAAAEDSPHRHHRALVGLADERIRTKPRFHLRTAVVCRVVPAKREPITTGRVPLSRGRPDRWADE